MSPTDALSTTLQSSVPAEFADLSAADLAALNTLVQRTITDRSAAMDDAIKASLNHAPRLARPAIKKVLGL